MEYYNRAPYLENNDRDILGAHTLYAWNPWVIWLKQKKRPPGPPQGHLEEISMG